MGSRGFRNIVHRGMTAQLESTNIRNDGPAILRIHLVPIIGHGAIAVRNDLKNVAGRNVAKPVGMQRRGDPKPALVDHTVPISEAAMARAAVNVETVATASEQALIDRLRYRFEKYAALRTRMSWVLLIQLVACNHASRKRTGISTVCEEPACAERFVFRHVLHVSPASASGKKRTDNHNC